MSQILDMEFNAFIHKSVGKTLTEHEKNTRVSNQEEFSKKLAGIPGFWAREPGDGIYTTQYTLPPHIYFATDNRTFGEKGSHRLGSKGSIQLKDIGKMPASQVFKHTCGDSHQVQIGYYQMRTGIISVEVHGNITGPGKLTASPKEFADKILNVSGNKTLITFKSSASYPFMAVAPNIDYEISVLLERLSNGKNRIQLSGWHNKFPFYEFLLNGKIIYQYDALKHNQTGPGANLLQGYEMSAEATF